MGFVYDCIGVGWGFDGDGGFCDVVVYLELFC